MEKIICAIALQLLLFVLTSRVWGAPLEPESNDSLSDKYPVMVPVSSTVIPIVNLFGPPKGGVSIPKRTSAFYLSPARRARLLERSSRPEAPVRLITKNSKHKDANETH